MGICFFDPQIIQPGRRIANANPVTHVAALSGKSMRSQLGEDGGGNSCRWRAWLDHLNPVRNAVTEGVIEFLKVARRFAEITGVYSDGMITLVGGADLDCKG